MPDSRSRAPLAAHVRWVAASVAAAVGLLAGAEAGLRLAGLGAADATPSSRLRYQRIGTPTLAPARRADGSEVLRPVDPRIPVQSILRVKAPAGLRVIVFGGSATAGLGLSPNATFGRELERILRAAHPERVVELLNLGIVGIASKQVRLLVAEAARELDADLLVVYSGNNEFLEVHAAKVAEATAGPLARLVVVLADLHLTRVLRAWLPPRRREASPPERWHPGDEDGRPREDQLARVSLTGAEVEAVLDAYERNLEAMVAAARASGTPLLLATVASNWTWRGRDDLPEDWLDARLGESAPSTPERLRRARDRLTERLRAAPPGERHELLYERAVVERELGELAAARADYRAAMNADPHLRRALDAGNARVRRVATRRGVGLLDVVELLAAHARDGIVGFEEFYDHVHFTPRGSARVAAGLYEAMDALGLVSRPARFDVGRFLAGRLEQIDGLRQDPFAVDEWLGFGFDPAGIHDRDLWKYERLRRALDRRIAADPGDLAARVYRGNALYFEQGGGGAAARDWRAALALAPNDPSIRANLDRLASEGRASEGPEW